MGTRPPSRKRAEPLNFRPTSIVVKRLDGSVWHLAWRWASVQARWGPSFPPQKGGRAPQFSAHFYCGQTAGCIKMPLGMEVGFGPGDFVLDGDPATPKKGHSPPFSTHVYCGQTAVCIDQDTIWYGGRHQPRRHCVRWGLLPHVKGHSSPLHFGPCLLWPNGWMDQDTTWYGRRPRPIGDVLDADPAPSTFGPCLLWPNGPHLSNC